MGSRQHLANGHQLKLSSCGFVRSRKPVSEVEKLANERMQLTWLIGAPSRAGLGSPASRQATRPRLTRHAADASRYPLL